MSSKLAPSPEQFAQTVAEAYVNGKELEGDVVFDREKFQLIIKDAEGRPKEQIYLGHFFNEYLAADQLGRQTIIARATGNAPQPERSKEDYLAHLVVQVKDRWSVEKLRMSLRNQSNANDLPNLVVGDHLAALAAYDLPQQIAYASQNQLAGLGLTFEQALGLAKANLTRHTKFDFQKKTCPESGAFLAYESAWQDNYDAARIFCKHELSALAVEGEHVLFPLTVNRLLITGSQNTRGLAFAFGEMAQAQKAERPLPPFPLLLTPAGLKPFSLPEDSPLGVMFRELACTYVFNLHAWQREHLAQEYTAMVEGWQIAKYDLVADSVTGKLCATATVEKEPAPALLPQCDFVNFISGSGKIYKVAFSALAAVASEALEETGMYPVRYKLTHFPSEDELAKLAV